MEVRHNTQALEKALEHVVRKASIPFVEAEASANAKTARAQGFRRLATGAALGLAAVGIGLGIWLATRESPKSADVASTISPTTETTPSSSEPALPTPAPSKQATESPPIPRAKPAQEPTEPPEGTQTEKPSEDIITTDYSIFRNRTVTLAGRQWEISAGHQFDSERDPNWKRAWCYTIVEVSGVTVRVNLADRESPIAKPLAPLASTETMRQVQLGPLEALTLATKCPWLDEKKYSLTDFEAPAGTQNPFNVTDAKFSLNGRILSFSGSIGEDFLKELQKREFDVLEIDSPGGLLAIAIDAGRWLRSTGKQVKVVGNCLSACIFVLAGGVKRSAEASAHIGVHRFYSIGPASKDDTENAQIVASNIIRFLSDMGVDDELFHAMSATPAADMLYLDRSKLMGWRLLQPVEVSSPQASVGMNLTSSRTPTYLAVTTGP